jgi:hypothetical protein
MPNAVDGGELRGVNWSIIIMVAHAAFECMCTEEKMRNKRVRLKHVVYLY